MKSKSASFIRHGSQALFLGASLVACVLELRPPEETPIQCADQDDCPGQQICNTALQRCIQPGGDAEAPSLLTFSVSQAVVGVAGELRLQIESSEALGQDPILSLRWAAANAEELTLEISENTGNTYVFIYQSDVERDPEGPVDVQIQLLDKAGNPGFESRSQSFLTDFSPPQVALSTVSITYRDDSAVIFPVEGARSSTRTLVSFIASEELRDNPILSIGENGPIFNFIEAVGSTYIYEAEGVATLNSGYHVVFAKLVDTADNQNDVALGEVLVAIDTPDPADVNAADKVVYRRRPWGQIDSEGPHFSLVGLAGAAPGDHSIIVRAQEELPALELGRGQSEQDGRFNIDLIPADLPVVYVVTVDAAGNESSPQRVRDTEWTATFSQKRAGSTFDNPHELFRSRRSGVLENETQLLPLTTTEFQTLSSTAQGGQIGVQASAWNGWTERFDVPLAIARGFPATAYDPNRAKLIMFGGFSFAFSADTWTFDRNRWRQVAQDSISPSARAAALMAFDTKRGVAVLFGGTTGATGLNDTWEWDGESWRFKEMSAECTPPPRVFAPFAYHDQSGRLLMHGGCDDISCITFLDDSWWYDGNCWHEVTTLTPGARRGAAMGYDPRSAQLLLFGGCAAGDIDSCSEQRLDTWAFDGEAWTDISPKDVPQPPGRTGGRINFHAGVALPYLFGGDVLTGNCGSAPSAACEDIWYWDNAQWNESTLLNPIPTQRLLGLSYYDAERAGMVTGLGQGVSGGDDIFADLWLLAPNKDDPDEMIYELLLQPNLVEGEAVTIPARHHHQMFFDAAANRSVLYGGRSKPSCEDEDLDYCGLTWTFDGTAWSLLDFESLPNPGARWQHASTYDEENGRGLIFGGEIETGGGSKTDANDTWLFEDSLWAERCTGACTPPSPRHRSSMAYDASNNVFLLFGGTTEPASEKSDELWAFDGSNWSLLCGGASGCGGPSPRRDAGMVYDPGREVVTLHGGNADDNELCSNDEAALFDACSDTWEWDGGAWQQRCGPGTSCLGPELGGGELLYDPVRYRSVLVGARVAEVWQWDGLKWLNISPIDLSPTARSHAAVTYDINAEQLMLFGGEVGDTLKNDLWTLDLDPNSTVSLQGYLLLPQELQNADLKELSLQSYVGGRGSNIDPSADSSQREELSGVSLELWSSSPVGWREVSAVTHPSSAPGLLQFSAENNQARSYIVPGSQERFYFRWIPPPTGNGDEPAEVFLDAVEFIFRYRLPSE